MPTHDTPTAVSSRRHAIMMTILLAIMLLITHTPTATAVPIRENAALKYWRAFALFPVADQRAVGRARYTATEYALEPDPDGSAISADSLLDGNQAVIRMLTEGSALVPCDFSVDWHEGVNALLPELALMRSGARLLLLDASRSFVRGEPDAAAERIAGAIRMSNHIVQDPVLLSALVGLAIFRSASELAQDALRLGMLTDEGRATIAAALDRFPDDDPFGLVHGVRGEERWVADWMETQLDGQWSTPEGFARQFASLVEPPEFNFTTHEEFLEQLHSPAIPDAWRRVLLADDFRGVMRGQVELYRLTVRMIADAWDTTDATERFGKIGEMVVNGDFGVLAPFLVPAVERAHRQDVETRRTLAELRRLFSAR